MYGNRNEDEGMTDITRYHEHEELSKRNRNRGSKVTDIGSKGIIYRKREGWDLYTLIRVRNNEVDVILPRGKIAYFVVNLVRPYHTKRSCSNENSEGK